MTFGSYDVCGGDYYSQVRSFDPAGGVDRLNRELQQAPPPSVLDGAWAAAMDEIARLTDDIHAEREISHRLRNENKLLADELEHMTQACRWRSIMTDPPVVHGVYLVMHQDRAARYRYLAVDNEDPYHYLKQNITHWAAVPSQPEDKP